MKHWPTTDDIRSAVNISTDRAVTEQLIYGIQKDTVYQCRVLGYSRGGEGKHSESVYFTLGKLCYKVTFEDTNMQSDGQSELFCYYMICTKGRILTVV